MTDSARTFLAVCVFAAGLASVRAELRVYPAEIKLIGPDATQQLLAVDEAGGRTVADRTGSATFTAGDGKVVAVEEGGVLRAVGDGQATVTVKVGGETVTVNVVVSGTKAPAVPGFRTHVLPTLTRTGCNSGACHGALAGKGGFKLSLRGYDPDTDHFVMTRQALARRVDLLRPDESLLLKKAARLMPHGGGARFDTDSVHHRILLDWIAGGAPGPRDDEPTLQRVEVLPKPPLAKPGAKLRTVVVGHYSDGATRDVTAWARFASSEDQVAGVGEDGGVSVTGHGEASISAIVSNRVATLTVTSPFPNQVADAAFDQTPRANFVDDHVLAKLKLLRVPPSPPCSDEEFVRRVYLDTCGVLPKPAAVAAFLADRRADKRAKLVDALLERPEYVDYWSHKWSDLLLVSTRRLPQPATWAFYRFVRQSVADNTPWDRFARELLTASGSTLQNGAGNYFVLHKDVTDLVESTSVTFLGMSINCARCHNHPLERWTQDQYWAMANLFARVGLKNGERMGDVLVHTLPAGEALHLRRGVALPPTPLDGKPLPLDAPADRRRHFADWLTAADNPFFAKAAVNRVWRNFMGRGLVEAEDDLRETNPPSNRELFDALAKDFAENGYDVKRLVRLIANSAAYQRSSKPLPGNAADDRFYSRYLVRRLPAEVILDAYSDVTGVPTPFNRLQVDVTGGARASDLYPAGTRAVQLPDAQLVSQFLDAFGRAERGQTCSCERTADSSVTQALHLNNGQTLNDKLRDKASRVAKWADGTPDAAVVDELFRLALGRPPSASEQRSITAILADAARLGPAARREAIEDACWAVLTGREFLFNH